MCRVVDNYIFFSFIFIFKEHLIPLLIYNVKNIHPNSEFNASGLDFFYNYHFNIIDLKKNKKRALLTCTRALYFPPKSKTGMN